MLNIVSTVNVDRLVLWIISWDGTQAPTRKRIICSIGHVTIAKIKHMEKNIKYVFQERF